MVEDTHCWGRVTSLAPASEPPAWLPFRIPSPGADLRLFCLPSAGSAAQVFRTWPESLPSNIEVCAVELPGRGTRLKEPPIDRMEPLLEALERMLAVFLDRPFALFGHSFGALLAFELAHRFSKGSMPPIHLFVSGRGAPQVSAGAPLRHDLPAPLLLEELRKLDGTPKAVLEDSGLMKILLPALRADLAIVESYACLGGRPKLACPITALGGLQDATVTPAMLDAWRETTACSFSRTLFAGGHFFLQKEQAAMLGTVVQRLAS
jgi:medium-chain acyl-[acyl-carrier-protein] hydrolase